MIPGPLGPVAGAYFLDNHRISTIVGPVGSAKSTASCLKLQRFAYEQKPGTKGIAYTRFAIVRETYRQLEDTTMKTWFRLFPENVFGRLQRTDKIQVWDFKPKGYPYKIHAEFAFRALDDEKDVANLLSWETTGFYFNEVREVVREITSMAGTRAGRYPSGLEEGTPTWRGWIGDSNMWDTEHYLHEKFVNNPDPDYILFQQPGGMEANAENLENLEQTAETLALPYDDTRRREQGRTYYVNALKDMSKEDADVYVHAKWGTVRTGKPIYTNYSDHIHCRAVEPSKKLKIRIGYDFGRTPAAVLGQVDLRGRWLIFDELCGFGVGVKAHGAELKKLVLARYPGLEVEAAHGDPSGDSEDADDKTVFQHLAAVGIICIPALTNEWNTRLEAVQGRFRELIDGEPAITIHPRCKMLRKACIDGYHYAKMKVAGNKYQDKPNKNDWSHVAEALQYILLGGGEGAKVLNRPTFQQQIIHSGSTWNPFGR